ncbi:unnamed protein product [Ostreobium quekettii]|uniref:Peptidase S1 domain-containing protein n=1 Tax=Ostreobium quekettii TaxID=121088 RepID=A0A8S1JCD8_9CHLO|nr:unnamed protein product [Ostreobium quekettii]
MDGAPAPSERPTAVATMAGGKRAICGRFPYVVSLRDRTDVHLCEGILVDEKFVLTAAHCVDPNDPMSLGPTPIIVIGACELRDKNNENGKVEVVNIGHMSFFGLLQKHTVYFCI